MSNRTLVDEIITLIRSEANNNPPPKSCKIIKNYGDAPYSDVEVEDLGTLVYKKTIGSTNIGSEGIICFLNGSLKQGIVITDNASEIDLSPIINRLDEINDNLNNLNTDLNEVNTKINDLDNSKSDINHTHPQYLTEHQDLSDYVLKSQLLNMIYPVGSIYMSVNNVNPSVLFGGTWQQIENQFLLASGSSYSLGSTGGSADAVVVSHNHTQNSHNHTQNAHNHSPNSNSFVQSNVDIAINGTQRAFPSSGTSAHFVYINTSKYKSSSTINISGTTANKTATNNSTTATNNETGVDGTGKICHHI